MTLFLLDFENRWYVLKSASHDTAPDEARDRWPECFDEFCWCYVIPDNEAHKIAANFIGTQVTAEQANGWLEATGQTGDNAEIYLDGYALDPNDLDDT
jgi:hypothetical protein